MSEFSLISFSFALAVAFFSQIATAQTAPPLPTVSSKDWKVEACVASTTSTFLGINHHLEIAVDQAGIRPLEIRIRLDGETNPRTLGIKASLDRKKTQNYAFAPLAKDSDGRELFWNIPRGSEALISFLKREMKFEVSLLAEGQTSPDGQIPKTELTFSLRGSSNAISELQKRCNDKKALASDGFERAFLPAAVANVDPLKLNPAETARLRELLAEAHKAFRSSNQTQSAINALTAKYVVQLKEWEQLHRNLDRLTHTEIVKLQSRRAEAQKIIDTSNLEIPQIRTEISQTEATLVSANQDLETVTAILAPLLPEIRKLQSYVNAAKANLSTAQANLLNANNFEYSARSRVQDVTNAINNADSSVSRLQSEADRLRWEVQRARSVVDDARRDYQEADGRRRGYDRNGEFRNRVGRDSRHDSIEGEIRDRRGRMDDTNRSDMEREIGNLEREREEIRNRIERDIDRICNDMDRERDERGRRLRDAEEVADRLERNQRDLVNIDIPNAQNEVSRLRSLRLEAEADVRSAESSVIRAASAVRSAEQSLKNAQARLYSHKKSVGYAEKKAAVEKAEDRVDELKKDLSRFDREIAKREQQIRDETKNLSEIEKLMQAVVAKIREKEARTAEVQKMLEPYTAEHTELTARKTAADQTFAEAQTAFAQSLPQLSLAAQ